MVKNKKISKAELKKTFGDVMKKLKEESDGFTTKMKSADMKLNDEAIRAVDDHQDEIALGLAIGIKTAALL